MTTDLTHDSHHLVTIRAVGPAADGGSLPLSELARIAGGFQATLDRLAIALHGQRVGPGRRRAQIVNAVQLVLTDLRKGSVCLGLDREGQDVLSGDQDLDAVLSALGAGIEAVRRDSASLPPHFDQATVNGLVDLTGGIAAGKLQRLDILRGGRPLFSIDAEIRQAVRELSSHTATQSATVVGRLHMGDFSPASLRCRVDTFAGSVLCDFDIDLKDDVLDAMDHMVMAHGTAQMQPDGSTVRTMNMTHLEKVETATSKSLDQLQAEQGISPLASVEDLMGPLIPDDEFAAYLAAIRATRPEGS